MKSLDTMALEKIRSCESNMEIYLFVRKLVSCFDSYEFPKVLVDAIEYHCPFWNAEDESIYEQSECKNIQLTKYESYFSLRIMFKIGGDLLGVNVEWDPYFQAKILRMGRMGEPATFEDLLNGLQTIDYDFLDRLNSKTYGQLFKDIEKTGIYFKNHFENSNLHALYKIYRFLVTGKVEDL